VQPYSQQGWAENTIMAKRTQEMAIASLYTLLLGANSMVYFVFYDPFTSVMRVESAHPGGTGRPILSH
jgi:hypothetical protein